MKQWPFYSKQNQLIRVVKLKNRVRSLFDSLTAFSWASTLDKLLLRGRRLSRKVAKNQWKARYQAANPTWATSRSTQPQRKPSQTPEPVVERILTLSRTLEQQGKQGKAAAIHQELTQQGIEPIPSRRTIYRIIQHHEQENL
jgi:hypothetical protein